MVAAGWLTAAATAVGLVAGETCPAHSSSVGCCHRCHRLALAQRGSALPSSRHCSSGCCHHQVATQQAALLVAPVVPAAAAAVCACTPACCCRQKQVARVQALPAVPAHQHQHRWARARLVRRAGLPWARTCTRAWQPLPRARRCCWYGTCSRCCLHMRGSHPAPALVQQQQQQQQQQQVGAGRRQAQARMPQRVHHTQEQQPARHRRQRRHHRLDRQQQQPCLAAYGCSTGRAAAAAVAAAAAAAAADHPAATRVGREGCVRCVCGMDNLNARRPSTARHISAPQLLLLLCQARQQGRTQRRSSCSCSSSSSSSTAAAGQLLRQHISTVPAGRQLWRSCCSACTTAAQRVVGAAAVEQQPQGTRLARATRQQPLPAGPTRAYASPATGRRPACWQAMQRHLPGVQRPAAH
jgi:hypothetical protein